MVLMGATNVVCQLLSMNSVPFLGVIVGWRVCRYIQSSEEDTQALQAKLARFASALDGFCPEMLDYVMEHAVPESVLEHPMYSLDPNTDWVSGRVALVGDAVHVMPPNMSQVCNSCSVCGPAKEKGGKSTVLCPNT